MSCSENFTFYDRASNGGAVLYCHRMFTFAMLDGEAEHLSSVLREHKVTEQSKIGILIGNTPLFLCSLFAVAKLKAAGVLLSTYSKKYELEKHLYDTGVRILISDNKASALIQSLSYHKNILYSASDPIIGDIAIWRIEQHREDISAQGHVDNWLDKEFIVQFTSGVSGTSKIVTRSYNNVIDEIISFSNIISLTKSDVCICPAPLFHAYGLINGFLASFYRGAKLLLMDKFVPSDLTNLIKRYRPTIFIGVPFMYNLLNKAFLPVGEDFSSLRLSFSAGAKLPKETAEDFYKRFGVRINQLYGSTETGVTALNLYNNGTIDFDSVGKPVEGRIIKIVDNDGRELPPYKEGEIKIKSPGTTKGYLNMPEINKRVFRDGCFFTGDVGWMDPGNNLYITGRKSSFINVAGLKVDPSEIERVLLSNSSVRECAVVGVPGKSCGEIIKAYVTAEGKVSIKELAKYCRERLADYKVPREIEFIVELPKSPTGKILRKYLIGEGKE